MNLVTICQRLTDQGEAIAALVRGVDDATARWKPAPAAWSILEVINHLADEECDDFRRRVDLTLHDPSADWPPIDPVGWVTSRGYAQRELAASLARFQAERAHSLAWLATLTAPNWEQAHVHPVLGTLRAGEIMASWLAHDLLHLRQLVELHYLAHQSQSPYPVAYAGDW